MLNKVEDAKKWLAGEGAKASLKDYVEQIENLKKDVISQLDFIKNTRAFEEEEKLFSDLLT